MRILRVSLILLICCVAFAGCFGSRIVKGYDFSGAQMNVEQKDLTISAALFGSNSAGEKEGGLDITIRGNPYTLFFVFAANSGYYREARVSNVVMQNEKNEIILPQSPPPGIGQFSESPGGSIAKIAFNHLELPYERLFLVADVEIMTRANSVIKQPIRFSFDPTYSEGKSND